MPIRAKRVNYRPISCSKRCSALLILNKVLTLYASYLLQRVGLYNLEAVIFVPKRMSSSSPSSFPPV